jgi:hypothetical protein
MSITISSLTLYAGVLLLIAAAIGYFFPHWRWNRVDLFYYPLGAIGILLLFQNSQKERQLIEFEKQQETQQTEINVIVAQRPETSMQIQSEDLLHVSFSLVQKEIELGQTCKQAVSNDAICMVAEKLVDPLSTIDSDFGAKTQEAASFDQKVEILCDLFPQMMDRLEKASAISERITRKMRTTYDEGLNKNFSELDFDAVRNYLSNFENDVNAETDRILSVLSASGDTQGLDTLRKIDYEESRVAEMLLMSFENCLRAPSAIRNGTLTSWRDKYNKASQKMGGLDEEIKAAKEALPLATESNRFRVNYWPLFLLFALALKFGKGVAAVRADRIKEKAQKSADG